MEKPFHILLEVPENFPEKIEEIVSEIDHDQLKIYGIKRPPQAWSSLEWAIPGLIVAYLAKPYFEGFLQEMGRDHYEILKGWLKRLLQRAKSMRVTTLFFADEKCNPSDTQSKAISIFIEIKTGQRIKLLFDETLTLSDWENGLEKMLQLIMDNYQAYPNDALSKKFENLKKESYYTIYGFLDRSTKEWRFIDDTGLFKIHKELAESKEKAKNVD